MSKRYKGHIEYIKDFKGVSTNRGWFAEFVRRTRFTSYEIWIGILFIAGLLLLFISTFNYYLIFSKEPFSQKKIDDATPFV